MICRFLSRGWAWKSTVCTYVLYNYTAWVIKCRQLVISNPRISSALQARLFPLPNITSGLIDRWKCWALEFSPLYHSFPIVHQNSSSLTIVFEGHANMSSANNSSRGAVKPMKVQEPVFLVSNRLIFIWILMQSVWREFRVSYGEG